MRGLSSKHAPLGPFGTHVGPLWEENEPTVGPAADVNCGACVGPKLWGPGGASLRSILWAHCGPTISPSGTAHTLGWVWAVCQLVSTVETIYNDYICLGQINHDKRLIIE